MDYMKRLIILYELIFCMLLIGCSSDPEPNLEPEFEFKEIEIEGAIWMDRNLGAKSPYDRGWLFQWGRPADGHQLLKSDTTLIFSETTKPGHNRFIATGIKKHWMKNPVYDYFSLTEVCPDGWRLPNKEDYQRLLSYITFGKREDVYGCMIGYLFFPETGYKGFGGRFELDYLNERDARVTKYLTRDVSGDDIYTFSMRRYLDGTQGEVDVIPEGRASFGYPIRCIKGRKDY